MDEENYEDFDDREVTTEEGRDWSLYSRKMGNDYFSSSAFAREIHFTEFSEGRINPTPLLLEESDILLEQYLSPGKLQLLAGVDDLKTVQSLELKVDSRETSLGNFGSLLPNLLELKLNGSHIACVRDLGSSLRNLRVLWMTRCGLEELDGISAMSELKELYLEYNEISDVSPLSMLENLEVLDLEGNNIEDITQVQYLSLCPTLRKLALDGNPICVCPSPTDDMPDYDFRETIKKLLPNLLILDEERLDDETSSPGKHNVFDEDWAYLEELQDEALLQDEFTHQHDEVTKAGDRPPTAAFRPATAYRPGSTLRPSSGFRPMSASRRPSTTSGTSSSPFRPGTSASNRPLSSDAAEGIESVSELTMGNVFCGNPSKALRQRRQAQPGSKEDIDRKLSKLLQKGAHFNLSENTDKTPVKYEGEISGIIEELRTWKLEHDRRMELILKSKEAQILMVNHDEDEDSDDCSDEIDDDSDESVEEDKEDVLMNMMDKYDYRSSYLRERYFADMQHRAETSTVAEGSSIDTHCEEKLTDNSRKTSPFSTQTVSSFSEFGRYDQSFDVEDDNLDLQSEPTSSPSSLSVHHQSSSQSGVFREVNATQFGRSVCQKSPSRSQSEAGRLAPLRIPSPSVQINNRMQSKLPEPHPPKQKRLRVGPTGLPLSSQTQQPVIRNNIAVIQSRSGLIQSCRPGSLQTNIVLLPSQPRIQRHLPEPHSLTPHPPRR